MVACGLLLCRLTAHADSPCPVAEVTDCAQRIQGESLAVWRDRISTLNLQAPTSAQWVPGLQELVRDRRVPWITRRQAALTLGRLGTIAQAAIPTLLEGLSEPVIEPDVVPGTWCAKGLGLMGPVALEAVPRLMEELDAPSASCWTQLAILEALARIGPTQPEVLKRLNQIASGTALPSSARHDTLLTTTEWRTAACEGLALIGPPAAATLPVLLRCAGDADAILRGEALRALGSLRSAGEPAIPLMVAALLEDPIPTNRELAAQALVRIGPDSRTALTPLLITLREPDLLIPVLHVLRDLPRDPVATAEFSPCLQDLLADSQPEVSLAAIEVTWRHVDRSPDRARQLLHLVPVGSREVRHRVCQLLGAEPALAGPLQADLEHLATHTNPAVRTVASRLARLWKQTRTP